MKIRKINWFWALFATGITLAPFGIYLKDYHLGNNRIINHEKIHWGQQKEMLIIFFYIWYLIEFGIRVFTNWGNAYQSISFEREAYANEDSLDYWKKRKRFSWIKYL